MLSIKVVDSISFLWENWLERGQLLKKVGKSVWYNSFIIEIVERGVIWLSKLNLEKKI